MKKIIVVAPDKFKGTFTAAEAASVIGGELKKIYPDCEIVTCALADGGEGTAESIARQRGWSERTIATYDAMGRVLDAKYYISQDGKEAAVDSSAVIGLQLIAPCDRDVMNASSAPLGLVIRQLVDSGVRRVAVGIGGTATSDGGAGMLQTLGVRFYDKDYRLITRWLAPAIMTEIDRVEVDAEVLARYSSVIEGLSDVAVPLCAGGDTLSALSFAWQKGLERCDETRLRESLEHLKEKLHAVSLNRAGTEYAGAGGGLGYALGTVLGCQIRAGAPVLISESGIFDKSPALIVTGEGRLDRQSFAGKVVGTLTAEAVDRNVPVAVIAGQVEVGTELPSNIIAVEPTIEAGASLPADNTEALENLKAAVRRLVIRDLEGQD